MHWSYGVTTVPKRLDTLLPRTLESLSAAGFPEPRLFVDGEVSSAVHIIYQHFGLEVTNRYPAVRTYGNWVLALWELYIREPEADRYAIFQDDLIIYSNLRTYLEQCKYPKKDGYWNLYTYPINQKPPPSEDYQGWHESNQNGRGAVALVFNRPTVTDLFAQQPFIAHPQNSRRGHKSVDGTVVSSLKNAGRKEYIHSPTLVQHTGHLESTMGNHGYRERPDTFRGESYDAMEMLNV